VLVTATSRASKLWPDDRWRALARHLAGNGIAVLLTFGTPDEAERCRRIADGIDGATLAPRLSLAEAASLLAHADVVAGVDTGLTHLAAALGTAPVAIFTETDAALAGVAICGGATRDLGGSGAVPTASEVIDALGELYLVSPRC
jgi:heptosyltransferase-1